jgi:hypothetical protein
MQYSLAVNNARLDVVESTTGASAKLRFYTGAMPANCAAPRTGTLLVEIALPSDWMSAASAGSKSKLGVWSATAIAGAGATPGYGCIMDSAGTTCHLQGTSGVGTGEIPADGTITAGQTVTVNSFTLNAANL